MPKYDLECCGSGNLNYGQTFPPCIDYRQMDMFIKAKSIQKFKCPHEREREKSVFYLVKNLIPCGLSHVSGIQSSVFAQELVNKEHRAALSTVALHHVT